MHECVWYCSQLRWIAVAWIARVYVYTRACVRMCARARITQRGPHIRDAAFQGYPIVCAKFVYGVDAPLAKVLWLFYCSKILDFMDTFFIITGKKWAQLSFLHVYHHSTIFMVGQSAAHTRIQSNAHKYMYVSLSVYTLTNIHARIRAHMRARKRT